ncbi:MAG: DUF6164 family protein [Mariprofundus sp.]
MAAKLFKLRDVPDDEAAEIRQLLTEHDISFYETEAGGWGISVPAIWIHDASQLHQAKSLIDDYQQQRAIQARAAYQLQKDAGTQQTVLDKIRQKPLQFILFFSLSLFILYITLSPFLNFLE